MIGLEHYLILSVIIFCIGLLGLLRRKNLLMLFFSTEIMLNAINLAFVSVSSYLGDITGQTVAFFVIAIAASEVAIGIALILLWFKKTRTIDLDSLKYIKG
ncbi:MAG: NADH-ubiquinone oxidoreductase chain K (EC [uncultured Campylobacterales bacterium]|uniref:NADH-quinone oxidoreductase subunit K n=1 Tax=uncultured Campylobacterales bacterium TaxID=352960 RepID=A0A6S6S8E6_9BACT|nr:MAG: NADH-ubiquinone oxidoreductase chain K (EC [uncultured Campylobacterales bacterium]